MTDQRHMTSGVGVQVLSCLVVVQMSMECANVNWKLHRLIMEHVACNMNLKEAEGETEAVKKRMSLLEVTNTHLTVELDFLEQYSRQNCLVRIIMG